MEPKDHIENIIEQTFNVIAEVYKTNREGERPYGSNRILFPKTRNSKKRDGKIRISEQELRFVFVEQLLKYIKDTGWDVYYSVETPTRHAYNGFHDGDPKVDDKKGQSGNIDLCIHDNQGERICLIEFKALNPIKADYQKDFCKLQHEDEDNENILRYFIQIVENVDSGTMDNIGEKIYVDERCYDNVTYKCYCLKTGKKCDITHKQND